ncbi:MAG: CDP-alcohol phosphatidyltransferase family protein [Candidatus Sungbacteria bacterium]|nr:CDP-alcohol phosphatidyltransferase family protein [Candidatus Sungbacteria bacterium]
MRSFFRRFYWCWRLAHRFQEARAVTHPIWIWLKSRLPMVNANLITAVRLVVASVAFYQFAQRDVLAAIPLYLAAALLDMVDGDWARANNEISTWGKIIDPLADKITVLAFLLLFGSQGRVHLNLVWVLVALEAFSTSVYAITALQGSVSGANLAGKIKKVLQDAVVLLALVSPGALFAPMCNLLLLASGVFSITSSWGKILDSRIARIANRDQAHDEKSA